MATLDIVAVLSLSGFIYLIRILPSRFARKLCRKVSKIFFSLSPRHRAAALRNLELAFPQMQEPERYRIIESSLNSFGDNIYSFSSFKDLKASDIESYQDFGEIVEAFDQLPPGQGALILGMHFGEYEKFIQFSSIRCGKISVIARGLGLPRTDQWVDRWRSQWGVEIFGRKGGYKEVIRRLKAGEKVVLLFDQNVRKEFAVFAKFFGIQSATTKAAGLAVIRTGVPLYFAAAATIAEGEYKTYFSKIDTSFEEELSGEEKVTAITERANSYAEEIIRAHPEQWFWVHRRFKTRPLGDNTDLYA